MKLQLENLSVEELKILREDINLLLKNKHKPKYKEEDCFINPKDFSFGYILDINNIDYVVLTHSLSDKNHHVSYVSEQFLDNCIIISQDYYDELYISKNDLFNDINKFRDEKNKEVKDFIDSLEKEFNYKVQEIIDGYKND